MVEAGHDVLAVSADGPDRTEIERNGIRFRTLDGSTRGFDLRADVRAARSFAEILRDERPDLVHTHNPKPGVYGRVVSRLARVPRVVNTVHGLYATADDSLTRRAIVYGLEAMASRFSHLELVQNIEDVELMTTTPLAPTSRIRFLGNGIDLTRFEPGISTSERGRVRSELGLADDAVAVVSVGRLVAEKGFPELLAASAEAAVPHVLVVIGPDDPEKADALPPGSRSDAEDRGVRFLGHRDDVARLLPAFDLFVLASHREGFPRAAMEAAACGLPIVATDIRGCRQVVDDGETGYLVAPNEVRPLAAAIDRLVGNPDLRRRFGAAGRAKAERDFDEKHVVGRLMNAYAELGV